MSRVVCSVISAALGLVLVPAATAKEGVIARLTQPLATAPSGGVPVEFVLEHRDTGDSFSALGIFVRVRTVDGRTIEVGAEERGLGPGRYGGLVRTRRGQIADLAIGLAGTSSGPLGTQRSDAMFVITNDPFPGVSQLAVSEGSDDGRSLPVLLLVLVAVGVGSVVLVAAGFRRGRFPLRRVT